TRRRPTPELGCTAVKADCGIFAIFGQIALHHCFMEYSRKDPHPRLSSVVECYWFVTNDDPAVVREKIVPDGFPEIIFHYGDPYRINLHGQWETQAKQLLAGQLTN